MSIKKLELFLTISGGVIYWQTPGLIGHKGLMDTIDRPFQYCLDLNNQGRFAAFNHHIKGEHYVSVTCAMFRTDDRGRPNAPYRFHAILPWAIYREKLGTDAFALASRAFSKEVLGRIYGNTQSETEGELFSPQVYQNFLLQTEVKRRPDITFMLKHWDEQHLKLFIGALIAGVAPPLRFRDDGNVASWLFNQHWSDRKSTDGERLLEELYLCLPDETCAWCNISTAWNRCDQFSFHLALDSRSSENAQAALTRVVASMTEEARRKAEVVVKQYVTPLFQAIADNNEKRINQLHRVFTSKSISWSSEQKMIDGESNVTDHNNSLPSMAKHPFVIGAMGIALVVGVGIGSWLFSSKGELKETNVHIKQETDALQNGLSLAKSESELAELLTAERKKSSQLKQQVSELSKKWIEEQNKYSELKKQLKVEQKKSSNLAQQLSAEQDKSHQLEQQVSELSTKWIEEQSGYSGLKKQFQVEQEKYGDLARQLSTEQDKSHQLEQQVSEFSTKWIEEQKKYSILKRELKTEQENSHNLRQQLSAAQENSRNLERQLNTAQENSRNLEQRLSTAQENSRNLARRLSTAQENSRNLERRLSVAQENSRNLERRLSTVQENSRNLEQQLSVAQESFHNLRQQPSIKQDNSHHPAQKPKQLQAQPVNQAPKTTIVINEIAWMGTTENGYDEWIELYNYGDKDINLQGWSLIISGIENQLAGDIWGDGFWVLKRKDNQGKETTALRWNATFDGVLWNNSKNNPSLVLKYQDNEVDRVDKWYAGDKKQDNTRTMERKSPYRRGNDKGNWCTASGSHYNWHSKDFPYDTGTPGIPNTCSE